MPLNGEDSIGRISRKIENERLAQAEKARIHDEWLKRQQEEAQVREEEQRSFELRRQEEERKKLIPFEEEYERVVATANTFLEWCRRRDIHPSQPPHSLRERNVTTKRRFFWGSKTRVEKYEAWTLVLDSWSEHGTTTQRMYNDDAPSGYTEIQAGRTSHYNLIFAISTKEDLSARIEWHSGAHKDEEVTAKSLSELWPERLRTDMVEKLEIQIAKVVSTSGKEWP